jgi:hypothetical protein
MSSSIPAEKAAAQEIISSSEDETGTDDDDDNGFGSVASVLTWTPNEEDSILKPNRPTIIIPPSRVRSRADRLYTEEEIGRLTLEAWRTRLRAMHEYIPDRLFSERTPSRESQDPASSVVAHEDEYLGAERKGTGGVPS